VDRVRVGDAMSLQVRRREQALTLTLRPAELPRKPCVSRPRLGMAAGIHRNEFRRAGW